MFSSTIENDTCTGEHLSSAEAGATEREREKEKASRKFRGKSNQTDQSDSTRLEDE
jgi:hypothetical protein